MTEALCLVFDLVPSQLPRMYWQYSLNDIKVKLKLYLGRQQALIMQQYDTLALLINQAFGSSSSSGKPGNPPTERTVGTFDEMKTAIASIF